MPAMSSVSQKTKIEEIYDCGEEENQSVGEDCDYDEVMKEARKSIDDFDARQEKEIPPEKNLPSQLSHKNLNQDVEEEKIEIENESGNIRKRARLYPMIPNYNIKWKDKFISIETSKVANLFITENKGYHWYITPDDTWRAFIDADARRELKSDEIVENAIKFFKSKFKIELQKTDFLVSASDKLNSYHIYIKKLKGTGKVLKQIFSEFGDTYYPSENKKDNIIDTSVYVNHLFRCPYQTNLEKTQAHSLSNDNLNRIDETVLNDPPPDAIFLDDLVKDNRVGDMVENQHQEEKEISDTDEEVEKPKKKPKVVEEKIEPEEEDVPTIELTDNEEDEAVIEEDDAPTIESIDTDEKEAQVEERKGENRKEENKTRTR